METGVEEITKKCEAETGVEEITKKCEAETGAEEITKRRDMETTVEKLLHEFECAFELPQVDIKMYSPLTLAYIGDGIYDLIIRTLLVRQGNAQVAKLHRRASGLVKASSQATMIRALKEELTEEEFAVFKRGRNAHSGTMAKNATVSDYRNATGFEALMGYLYLKKDWGRLFYLVRQGLTKGELYAI